MSAKDGLARRIAAGAGRLPCDLVIANARLYDLVTGDLIETDIGVIGGCVAGTYGNYKGRRRIDAKGRIAVPGFIDTHVHVESSLVTPYEFERCVLPHGVTTAICDPHEMANVIGAKAFDYFLACAETLIMDLRVQLSSCVPATEFETSGARIEAAALKRYMNHPKVLGLAEFMNFPGVVAADPKALDKIALFTPGHIDGHAPLLSGAALNAYIAAGIRTDHEATKASEALEKIRKGMTILIREGSVSKDLHALAPLLNVETSPFLALCTDDRNPLDIEEEGHIDFMIRTAIGLGVPPLAAYRAASMTAARAFGLDDRGMIAPGKRADIALIGSLEACDVKQVFVGGLPVTEARFEARKIVKPVGLGSMKARKVSAADFAVQSKDSETPVIGVIPGKIITVYLRLRLPRRAGEKLPDISKDVVRVAVVERHGRNGNVGNGFVKGFGLRRGAIASSVGHDSHNVTVVGLDPAEMALAVNRLRKIGGGFAVADGGRIAAELALPIAGLMSGEPQVKVRARLRKLRAAAKALGVVLPEPFLQVAFLPLPVIPHLKITDRGMFDVDKFALIAN